VRLRAVPEIYFHLDTSYEKFHQVNELLKDPKVQKDLIDPDLDATPPDDE
jgi:ribosome-binding factor A